MEATGGARGLLFLQSFHLLNPGAGHRCSAWWLIQNVSFGIQQGHLFQDFQGIQAEKTGMIPVMVDLSFFRYDKLIPWLAIHVKNVLVTVFWVPDVPGNGFWSKGTAIFGVPVVIEYTPWVRGQWMSICQWFLFGWVVCYLWNYQLGEWLI